MDRRILFLVVVLAGTGQNALATEPGTPLGCSDWVFLEPGLHCTTVISFPCANVGVCNRYPGQTTLRDGTGRQLVFDSVDTGAVACGQPGTPLRRWEVQEVRDNGTVATIAHITDRCVDAASTDVVRISGLSFDPVGGQLFVVVSNSSISMPTENERYQGGWQRIRIDGFATLFDVLQTYQTPSEIVFRVPFMPEGLPGADWFDTYYGDLATVGDWSQARPLRCGYPRKTPTPGEFLTIGDGVPRPEPGHGYYFITSATYQGQQRYGRSSSGGVFTGRDPSLLPPCG